MSIASNPPRTAPQLAAVDYDPFAQPALARVVPITEPQREVWLADKLGRDGSLAYNESLSLRLRGALDEAALRAAVRGLGERHESLRATISPGGDELCIVEDFVLDTTRHELSHLDADARDAAVRARLQAVVETPFDLERGPLIRAELLALAPQDHLLVLTAHHIVCDGWSFGVLVHDLAAAYAHSAGKPGAGDAGRDAPPASSFTDYAQSQAALAQTAVFQQDESYWLSQFTGTVPSLDLPTDRPRPRWRTFASGREDHTLDPELVAALRRLGAQHGASLFASLFTGIATLMRRLSGQSEVVVGIAAAGQSVGGHDRLVGHCVNILPVRTDADFEAGFATALQATSAGLLDAFEHQQYTFGTLLRKLAIPRDPGRLPLVNVLFNLDQPLDASTVQFPGLDFECSANARSYENFELFVNAMPVNGGLRLECQYNRDLFDAATVRRWMGAYEALLRVAVARPQLALAQLPLVDACARAELVALQPVPTPYDRQMRAHEFFEAQADRTPQRIAVRAGDTSLTYAGLEARSNRIAHLLRARGVRRGGLVGLAMDRGADLLATVLAVLKAGAGYVPLDPAFPDERLAYMIGDAGIGVLLTQRAHAARFDRLGSCVLMLDALDPELAAARSDRIGRDDGGALPDSVAYVIYTSGSTGQPKGVQVPHRTTANFIPAMQRAPGIAADDRLVAVTTLSFDIAFMELMLPLSVGAQVVIADQDQQRDGAALRALVESSDASYLQATPAGWRVLVEAGWQGRPGFKAVTGGEPLATDLADALLARCGEVWNGYGPTETTIYSTCWRVADPAAGICIGRPVANTQVWIRDAQGQLCPIGVPGELWIGGDGVSLGYLDRPGLNAERFVDDPYSTTPDARLYRTGDRGRWRNDGNLEHLGRLDFQVKVRGYRIELGEIEANLASHPDVARCVVIAREDRPGDVRLVGYVVAQPGTDPGEDALREHLRAVLPAYMMPQHLVRLAAVPLSPNGKVDRTSLPAPDSEGQRALIRIAPRTDLERTVAAAMEQVLALPEIAVDDDFFALGGHSLLAAQLTSRLNRALGVSLSLRALFDAPTVAGMAALLEAGAASGNTTARTPIARRVDQHHAPLSLMQERLVLLERFNPGQVTYNTPSAHRLTGALDVAALDQSLRDVAQRQTVLRTTVGEVDGHAVQVVHDDIDTGLLDVQDLTHLPASQREAELALRLQALVDTPFADLGHAPLFCARLFKLQADVHVLFFMPHHIIWDGWSFDLLYAELSEIYAARIEHRAPALPALPVSYGDYAAWHRDWVQGPGYAQQLAFWRGRLGGQDGGRSTAQALPTDKPRRPGMSGQGRSQELVVPKALTQALRAAGLRMDATLFVILLAAYCALIGRVTGLQRQVVATPVRGRNTADVEGLMGYFTNLLPLSVEIDPAQPFAEAVRRVRAVVLDSLANPDIRLEDLGRELSLRSAGGGGSSMLYQSLFSFQDIRQRILRWGNLAHERVEVFQPGASEDLGLWFIENDQGLTGGLIYNADIFHDHTATLLRQRYLQVLDAVARDCDQSVEALTRFDDGQPVLIGSGVVPVEAVGVTAAATADIPAARDAGRLPSAPGPGIEDPRVRYLVDLWSGLLGTPVEPTDNFFDLGGNSMLGVQMAEQVARDTHLRIKLVRLASQELRQIAADLPENPLRQSSPGISSRLARGVKRLFGRTATEIRR